MSFVQYACELGLRPGPLPGAESKGCRGRLVAHDSSRDSGLVSRLSLDSSKRGPIRSPGGGRGRDQHFTAVFCLAARAFLGCFRPFILFYFC